MIPDPARLTEAQYKTLKNLAANRMFVVIPPITRRWLLRAGYIQPNAVQPHPKGFRFQITDNGRAALECHIKTWMRAS